MSYLSISFVLMVFSLLIVYYSIPLKWNVRPYVLLIGSIVFYCSINMKNIAFLLSTAVSTFYSAQAFDRTEWKENKKLIFIGCIIFNVGIWVTIKLLSNDNFLSSCMRTSKLSKSIVAPLGISYFTLQAISYLADAYNEKIVPERCFGKYLLFLCYFPAIVQGPISRYAELTPQLFNKNKISFESIRKGLLVVAIGLIKKMVIADRLKIFVDACFQSYSSLSGLILYISAVCYSIQIYTDFSGCTDICYGISILFNVQLIKNFNRPYLARSIKDFWKRWHISLSHWLRDYIYIPLGGSRTSLFRKNLNVFLTFLVSGIWHGAGFHFIFWALLHVFYQISGDFLSSSKIKGKILQMMHLKENSICEHFFQIILTFNLVTFAWIFFRAQSLAEGMSYFLRMLSDFRISGKIFELGVNFPLAVVLIVNIVVLFWTEIHSLSQDHAIYRILNFPIVIRWIIYFIFIFDIILFGVYGSGYDMAGFLYGEF